MLKVSVISPESVLFEGEAASVVAPAYDGEVGILENHAPMMTLLGKGTLRLGTAASEKRFSIEGGFLQVVENSVRIVTERAAAASAGLAGESRGRECETASRPFRYRALIARAGCRAAGRPKSYPLHFSDIAYSLITQCPRLGPSQVWGAGAWITRAEHPARNAFPGGGA